MSKRLLFCVETTPRANTDYAYIKETVEYYYALDRRIVLRPIYMKSKTRYNSKAVQEDIRRQSGSENTSVIYCIDTDDYDTSPDAKEILDQITKYCRQNGYDFVFFCKDVEDVYLGKRIPNTQKGAAIRYFRTSHAIEQMKTKRLETAHYQHHSSNILNVLDRYLTRKK